MRAISSAICPTGVASNINPHRRFQPPHRPMRSMMPSCRACCSVDSAAPETTTSPTAFALRNASERAADQADTEDDDFLNAVVVTTATLLYFIG
jgi:hypothetical protein